MKKQIVVLLTILIVATILRVYQLDKVPPSLFGDELDVGYQAYSILKTGKDLYGTSLPTLIHSLSEYRAPLFIYSDIPFIAIFGLNEWGVRLAAAFWGILGILGIFFLTRKLFNERIGLFAAVFLAVSPWHIHYSRAGFEVTMLLTFFIFATYFFLKGMEREYYLIVSAILFALTPYIYSTAILFMPLLLIILFLFYMQSTKKAVTTFVTVIVVMVLILFPYGMQSLSGKAGQRFNIISIFTNQSLEDKVLLSQKNEQLPADLQRFFHNKPLIWMQNITLNYLRSFSPEFLFLSGDPNVRHSIHEMGQMYFFEIILLGLAILGLLGKLGKGQWLVVGWLVAAPVPAALTYDGGFHATRNFLMVLPLMILLALGANSLLEDRRWKMEDGKSWILAVLMILAIFNITFFLHRYFVHYPIESSRAWHFGFKEAMRRVLENENNYDTILTNNTYEPSLIRFLFWTTYDPGKFHGEFKGDKPIKNISKGFDGFSLQGKYFFGKVNGPYEEVIDHKTLYVASARDDITNPATLLDSRVKLLDTIYSPTGEPIFYLITGTK